MRILLRALALGLALAVAAGVAAASARAEPFLRRTPTVAVVERVGPSVVNITTERVVAGPNPFSGMLGGDPRLERFFQDFFVPREQRVRSLGSGVIVDADRHVLTNEHVIAGASRIRVALADGREFDAELVGADPNNDLAVLRIETDERLPWTPPGTSSDLMVGEPVIAIGNPFGLSNTVTTGVVSALDRDLRANDRVYYGFLQTDASINPGNSGGPLLNAEGSLVAINTAIYGNAQGIGFAIPIDVARRVMDELIAHGAVAPVWLGLELQDLDADLASVLELPRSVRGVLVASVRRDSAAARAGVERGDLVVSVDGHPVRTARDYYQILARATPGQKLALELWRSGEPRRVAVEAQQIPAAEVLRMGQRRLGLEVEALPGGGFRILAVAPGSGAERIGIRPGDLLLAVNGRPLEDESALRSALLDLRGRSRALLVVQRGPGRYHVTVPLS